VSDKLVRTDTGVVAPKGYDDDEAAAAAQAAGADHDDRDFIALPSGRPLPKGLGPGWTKVTTVRPSGASRPYDVYAKSPGTGEDSGPDRPDDKPKAPAAGKRASGPNGPGKDPTAKPAAAGQKGSGRGRTPKNPPGKKQLEDIDKNFAPTDVGDSVGDCALAFAVGFIEGGLIAVMFSMIVMVLFPEFAIAFAALGLAMMATDALDLIASWGKLTPAQRSKRVGRLLGGLAGGKASGKMGGRGLPADTGPPRAPRDPWISEQGTRPEPGSRDVTQEQFREGDGTYRAKDTAERYSGHGHGRHGAQTTEGEQIRRVQTGETPDGNRSPTSKATRFDSHAKEVEAVERAKAKEPWNGQPEYRPNGQPNRVNAVVPDGPEGYGEGVEVQRDANSQPLPGRPVQPTGRQPNANVVFEYNPETGEWDPVTQYPTDDPPTP
jgi:hypothetical protein